MTRIDFEIGKILTTGALFLVKTKWNNQDSIMMKRLGVGFMNPP